MRKTAIALGLVCVAGFLGWLLWPSIVVGSLCFADKKGEASGRRGCDRIVGVGPRAIPAIIRSVKRNSPWVRRYCYLPIAPPVLLENRQVNPEFARWWGEYGGER